MKNALLLTAEIFKSKLGEESAQFLKLVLPAVLLKTIYEKNFIVIEAK